MVKNKEELYKSKLFIDSLPSHWCIQTIESLCERITSGGTPSRKKLEFYKNGTVRWIKTKELKDSYIDDSEEKITIEALKNSSAKLLPINTVLMAMYGDGRTITSLGILRKESSTNQACCALISNPEVCDYLFLFYSLMYHRNDFIHLASGGAQRNLNSQTIRKFEIRVPPLPTQHKIASILSAYDDLIENNTRRIKILEEMARSLYHEWFVNFRFPNHDKVNFVDSELGLIPEGWEVKELGKVVKTIGGGTPSTKVNEYWENGDIIWFSPTDLTKSNTIFVIDSSKRITELGLKKSSAKIFPAYSVMMTSRATIGVVAINTKPASTNQGFITCIPNDLLSAYQIYYWIITNKEKIINLASGATFKEINKTTFRQLNIAIPNKEIKDKFLLLLTPIFKQIENLQIKNSNLRKTRDILLPKLISGEIDVENLDITTEQIAA